MPSFIPDDMENKEPTIPWFEEVTSESGIKGHYTKKSIEELKTEIKAAMSRLGGGVKTFMSGTYETEPKRYGYLINFAYGSREGRIEIAALPMEKETEGKRKRALKQALFTAREMLEAQFNSGLLVPGSAPLIPYLLDDQGRTLSEAMAAAENIPLLSPPMSEQVKSGGGDVVDGEFTEVKDDTHN